MKSPTKEVEVTSSYSSLEYWVIKLVEPRKTAQNPLTLPQKIFQIRN